MLLWPLATIHHSPGGMKVAGWHMFHINDNTIKKQLHVEIQQPFFSIGAKVQDIHGSTNDVANV